MIKFAPKKHLPSSEELRGFRHIASPVGLKLMIFYYSKYLGMDFEFQKIENFKEDCFRQLNCRSGGLWTYTGLNDIYPEQFQEDTSFVTHLRPELYGLEDVEAEDDNFFDFYPEIAGLDFLVSEAFLATTSAYDGVYTPSSYPAEDVNRILYDRFVSSKKIDFPDTEGGRVTEMVLDGLVDMLFGYGSDISHEFEQEIAFWFAAMLQKIFWLEDDADSWGSVFNCYTFVHPDGKRVMNFLDSLDSLDKDEQDFEFFTRAKEVIDSCMELITTAYCETGESPDFYEYDYHTNGDAMALTVLYFSTVRSVDEYDISTLGLAIYFLFSVTDEVLCRMENIKSVK